MTNRSSKKFLWQVCPRGFANEFYIDYQTEAQVDADVAEAQNSGNFNYIVERVTVQEINRNRALREEIILMMRNFNYQFYEDCLHGYIDKWNIINAIEKRNQNYSE